jgi:phage FluMu protein Com
MAKQTVAKCPHCKNTNTDLLIYREELKVYYNVSKDSTDRMLHVYDREDGTITSKQLICRKCNKFSDIDCDVGYPL